MFNKKNHVGRPSNEELRKIKNKKLFFGGILIVLIVFIILLGFSIFSSGDGNSNLLKNDSVSKDYTCPYGWEQDGDQCYRSAVQTTSLYRCIKPWKKDKKNGTLCYKAAEKIVSKTSCPNGWKPYSTKCRRLATNVPRYTCPKGERKGAYCYTKPTNEIIGYGCPSGWIQDAKDNKKCYRSASDVSNNKCPNFWKKDGNHCYTAASRIPGTTNQYYCTKGDRRGNRCYKYNYLKKRYTCSVGNPKGARCYISASPKYKLKCDVGHLDKNNRCRSFAKQWDNYMCSVGNPYYNYCYIDSYKEYSFKCDEGEPKNSYCYKKASESRRYTCSVGNLKGARCYIPATRKASSGLSQQKTNDIIETLTKIATEAEDKDPYGGTYQDYFGLSHSNDWCAAFIWWLFNQDDRSKNLIVKDGTADGIVRESVKKGLGTWHEDKCYTNSKNIPTYTPKAGDLILFNPEYGGLYYPYPESANYSNSKDAYVSSHIGYIYEVKGDIIKTIEGNRSNKISYEEYKNDFCSNTPTTDQRINGYYTPNYNK